MKHPCGLTCCWITHFLFTVAGRTARAVAGAWRFRPLIAGSLAMAAIVLFSPTLYADPLGEALNAPDLVWTTGGDAPWWIPDLPENPWFAQTTVTHDGVSAAQSGNVTNGWQGTWQQTVINGPAALVFWCKVDSDPTWRCFEFSVNDQVVFSSGYNDWQPCVNYLNAGVNTVKWRYFGPPDGPSVWGSNAAWVDQVFVTNTVGLAPVIVDQPPAGVVALDNWPSNVVLQAVAVGDPPLSYQWLLNGNAIDNANSSSLAFWQPGMAQAGDYQLVITNAWGAVTSTVCTLTITDSLPGMDAASPADTILALGADFSLNWPPWDHPVWGTQPFAIQWYKDGAMIPSATDSSIPITGAASKDQGEYWMVLTNVAGSVTSRVAHVTVSADLPVILGQPDSAIAVSVGDGISLGLKSDGPQPLTQVWMHNDTNVIPAGTWGDYRGYQGIAGQPGRMIPGCIGGL